jgi:succinate dehydrogenase (ubiquinone) membrane anchor subunit
LISAGLIPLTLAPFIGGSLNPLTDAILGVTILIHSHIGFQACIIDYFPTYRVPKIQNALMWALRAATILTGIGFYEFETSTHCPNLSPYPDDIADYCADDVGITQAIARIWKA